MNTVKHFLAIALLLLISLPSLQAQNDNNVSKVAGPRVKVPKKTPEQRAKVLTDTLSSVVGLSAEQYEKAYASNLKYCTQKETLKGKKDLELEQVKDQMKEISKTRKSEIAAVLTPEQAKKWQTWKKARKTAEAAKIEEIKAKHPNAAEELKEMKESKSKDGSAFDDIGDM